MKNLIKIISVALFFVYYNASAQEVIKTDTLGETPLTMVMDAKIQGALQDMEDNCNRANTRSTRNNSGNDASIAPTRVLVPSRDLTTAEICRRNPRIMGVKIQLAVVKSNEEANEVKAYFRRRFPNLKVQTDASLRPNYKILAGSYFNKQSASGDLSRIRQYFKSAIPVNYMIFCAEAK